MDDFDASVIPIVIPGEDDVAAFGEGSADGFEGFPTHQHRMAEGGFFKEREVFRKMPWQSPASSDEAVRIHSDDGDEHIGLR